MSNNLLKCDSCGFEKKLTKAQAKEMAKSDSTEACPQCGEPLSLNGNNTKKKNTDQPILNASKEKKAELTTEKASKIKLDDSKLTEPAENMTSDSSPASSVTAEESSAEAVVDENTPETEADKVEITTPDADAEAIADDPTETVEKQQDSTASYKETLQKHAETVSANAKSFASQAETLVKGIIQEGKENPRMGADFTTKVLNKMSSMFCLDCQNKAESCMKKVGHYAILIASAIALIMGILISLRSVSLTPLVYGICFSIVFILGQYVAVHSFNLQEKLLASTNGQKLNSSSMVNILGVASLGLVLLGIIIIITRFPNFFTLSIGVLLVIGAFYGFINFMHASEIFNLKLDEKNTPAEQVFGIVGLFAQVQMKVSCLIFGLGSLLMLLLSLWPLFMMIVHGTHGLIKEIHQLEFILPVVLFCIFAPLISYLLSLVAFSLISVLRGLTNIGNK